MKTKMLTIVALAAVAAVAAPDKDAQKKEQELKRLTQQNNQKVQQLQRAVSGTFNETRKPKDFVAIASNVNEIVKLASLKEGAANCTTPAKAKLLLAQAYAKPVNLRYLEQAKKLYAEALAAAAEDDKAKIQSELDAYLVSAGQKEAPEASAAEPKPPATDPKALRAWYERRTGQRYWWEHSRGVDVLAPEEGLDFKLKACDEAMAAFTDPGVRAWFRDRKASILLSMCKWREVEAIYLEELAGIKDPLSRARCNMYDKLAKLYVARAARYYEMPNRELTMKAVWYWEEAVRVEPKNTGWMRPIVERAFMLDDWELAKTWLDKMVAARDGKPDEFIAACYGDVAYHAGDYAKAVEWYETFKNLPETPQRVRIPNVHQRHTGALFALGRYEDCLKSLEKCPNFWSFKDTNAYYKRILKAKIEAQKKTAETAAK